MSQITVAKCRNHKDSLDRSALTSLFSFDSSKDRGEFVTKIGVKKVIQGTSKMFMS
jgi:hypothetical protein